MVIFTNFCDIFMVILKIENYYVGRKCVVDC
jgi:hypothetical protein